VSIIVKNNNSFEQAEPVTRECPHCGANAQLVPIATPSYQALMQTRPRYAGICFRCAGCNEPRFARLAIRSFGPDQIVLSTNVVEIERPKERFQFGYLPAPVERLFREALDCYTADLYTAFAVMCRRVVQTALAEIQTHTRPHLYDLFKNAVALSEMDVETTGVLETVLFATDRAEPDIGPEEAAALIEIVKDVFYQRYVRTAKLKAAIRMRRFFAGEITQKITPIGVNKRQTESA
jgi:hypothetical protein